MLQQSLLVLLAIMWGSLSTNARADAAPTPGDSRYPSNVLLERAEPRAPLDVVAEQPIGPRATQPATSSCTGAEPTPSTTGCVGKTALPPLAGARFMLALGVMVGGVGTMALGSAIFLALSGWGADFLVPAALVSMVFSAVMIGAGVYWLRKLRRVASGPTVQARVAQKIDAARSHELSFRLHGRGAQVQVRF